jgi:hypothetical protein
MPTSHKLSSTYCEERELVGKLQRLVPNPFVYEHTVAILRRSPAGSCNASTDLFDLRGVDVFVTRAERAPPRSGSKGGTFVIALRDDEDDDVPSSAGRCLS